MSYLDGSIAVTTTGKTYHYEVREYRCGYRQALTDAVEKLKKMNVFYLAVDDESEFPVIYQKDAIAAIEALEENNG